MALSGQPERARAVFERAAAFVNDVGLLAEEVDAETGELLGNFPQAFSHIGLVNAAWAISEAERRQRTSAISCAAMSDSRGRSRGRDDNVLDLRHVAPGGGGGLLRAAPLSRASM